MGDSPRHAAGRHAETDQTVEDHPMNPLFWAGVLVGFWLSPFILVLAAAAVRHVLDRNH